MKRTGFYMALMAGFLAARVGQAAPPALPALPIPQSFGVAIHAHAGDAGLQAALVKEAGFGWVRIDFPWADIERTKGVYDFSAYDKIISAFRAAGLRQILILDYANKYYDNGLSPVSPEAVAAFTRFAAAGAGRYAGPDIVWEIYNEPNIGFWKPQPDVDHYIKLADATTQAIRRAAPDAAIVGPALAGPVSHAPTLQVELAYLDKVLGAAAVKEWSAITLHPYRDNQPPETVSDQLSLVRAMMTRHGLDPQALPVASSEWGYSTWAKGVDEQTQAAYAVRSMLWSMAEHMPFSVWYDWQDDGKDDSDREYRFGLIKAGDVGRMSEQDRAKPAFTAMKRMSGLLDGYSFDRVVEDSPAFVCLSFVKGAQRAFALWSKDGAAHDADLAVLPPGEWAANHLLGDADDVTVESGDPSTVWVDRMPLIIVQR